MSFLVERARRFAKEAHRGQTRKYTGEPYFDHPVAVSVLLLEVPGVTPEMMAAALLHDVVEDCGVAQRTILSEFGETVSALVYWLTDVSKPTDGNRATRKNLDLLHIANAPAAAKTIKLADLIDNTLTIRMHDPEFAKVYMQEKRALLRVLQNGDPGLYAQASKLVEDYFKNN